MRRRDFIKVIGSTATWPLTARAQQRERVRRIGVFMPGTADGPEYLANNAAFLQALGELGWIVGRNVRIDFRWGAGDVERYRDIAADLVSLAPDAVLAEGYATVSALQKATRSVPIVFVDVIDPVGGSLVASLARPGGNTTGFLLSEFGSSGKWLELLKEIAPVVTHVAVFRDLVWRRHDRPAPPCGPLCRSHPQGRKAGRPTGAGADQIRADDQLETRQGARPRSAADAARPRRRGDRNTTGYSAYGTGLPIPDVRIHGKY
jgi:ABC transporter substrate binding protein